MAAPFSILANVSIGGGAYSVQDITAYAPFSDAPNGTSSKMTFTETIFGIGTATVTIYDPTNSIKVQMGVGAGGDRTQPLSPLQITDLSNSDVKFTGYIQKVGVVVQATYRFLVLSAVDLNAVKDTTLVGIALGHAFVGPDAQGNYTPEVFDAAAFTTDQATIQMLYDQHWLYPYQAIDPVTWVPVINGNLLPNSSGGTDQQYTWSGSTLRQASDDTCTLSSAITVSWIAQNGMVHLALMPGFGSSSTGALSLLVTGPNFGSYTAPNPISDGGGAATPYENFAYEEDWTGYTEEGYVNGAATFQYNPHGALMPQGGVMVLVAAPVVETRGTGFVDEGGGDYPVGTGHKCLPGWLDRYLDIPQAYDSATRDAVGVAAVQRAQTPLVKGSCDVFEPRAWHAGQILTITNAPAGLTAVRYMIQTVRTSILSGAGIRRVTLEWGTAPSGRLGLRLQQANAITPPPTAPGNTWVVTVLPSYVDQAPNVQKTIVAQLYNNAGDPWQKEGLTVLFGVTVFDANGNDVTSTRDWAWTATSGTSDQNGKASSTFTTATISTAQPGDYYVWFASDQLSSA